MFFLNALSKHVYKAGIDSTGSSAVSTLCYAELESLVTSDWVIL